MSERVFQDPGRVVTLWVVILTVLFAATLVANASLFHYVQDARERDPNTYLDKAEELMNQHDFAQAARQVRIALEKDPRHPRTYKVQGDLFFGQKQWLDAVSAYRRAIDLRNNAPGIRSNSLWALIELGRYQDAVDFGRICMEAGDRSPIIPRYVAEALFRAERWPEAIPYIETALEDYTEDVYLLSRLKQAYESTGETEKMQAVTDRINEVQTGLGRAL